MTVEITPNLVGPFLPPRPPEAHKNTFGHLFVLAGSRGFTGAAKLCCNAAMRSGVGLVTAGVPAPLGDVVAAGLYEVMSLLLPATDKESFSREAIGPALEFAEGKQAVVLGPGLSQHPQTREFVLEMVKRVKCPMVVDADALNALSSQPEVLREAAGARILTPHPGEMARLTGLTTAQVQADRENVARRFIEPYKGVLVLKGRNTLVLEGTDNGVEGPFMNVTGNSGLATGGTGDVLAGLIGGLLAQGTSPMGAALLGAYLQGLAGDMAAARMTQRGMIASDVIDALPDAWRLVEQECRD